MRGVRSIAKCLGLSILLATGLVFLALVLELLLPIFLAIGLLIVMASAILALSTWATFAVIRHLDFGPALIKRWETWAAEGEAGKTEAQRLACAL